MFCGVNQRDKRGRRRTGRCWCRWFCRDTGCFCPRPFIVADRRPLGREDGVAHWWAAASHIIALQCYRPARTDDGAGAHGDDRALSDFASRAGRYHPDIGAWGAFAEPAAVPVLDRTASAGGIAFPCYVPHQIPPNRKAYVTPIGS